MSCREVLNNIEILRSQLVSLAQNKPLIDPEVVQLSQRLDEYLNKYYNANHNFIECR